MFVALLTAGRRPRLSPSSQLYPSFPGGDGGMLMLYDKKTGTGTGGANIKYVVCCADWVSHLRVRLENVDGFVSVVR
jgi:hypothetical protein